MRRGDPHDPLLRPVLPLVEECAEAEGYVVDPVGGRARVVAPGILHEYADRALLITTGACAIHCRYSFRRHFRNAVENAATAGWQSTPDWLRSRPDVTELMLSGGDPLSLTDRRPAALSVRLRTVPGVRRLRLHTGQPIVLPEPVDAGLLEWIDGLDLP